MCQLLGFSRHPEANPAALLTPETLCEFAARGGLTDCHADGWGLGAWGSRGATVAPSTGADIAPTPLVNGAKATGSAPTVLTGRSAGSLPCAWLSLDFERRQRLQIWRDKAPAHTGRLAQLLSDRLGDSAHFLSHLRRATWGAPSLDNTHPFTARVLGRDWAFAHNGHLPAAKTHAQGLGIELAPNATDSQHALAWMAHALGLGQPFEAAAPAQLGDRIARALNRVPASRSDNQKELSASEFERLSLWHEAAENEGTLNTLMGCEAGLFAHASTHLWMLEGAGFTLIATEPVGEGVWRPLRRGQSIWIRDGRVVLSKLRTTEPPRFAPPPCIGLHPNGLDGLDDLDATQEPLRVGQPSARAEPPLDAMRLPLQA